MSWKDIAFEKVKNYMVRDAVSQDQLARLFAWWQKCGLEIINEFEFVIDEQREKAAGEELKSLKQIILADANIDQESANVGRILQHLDTLIAENAQEVDYENPSREDLESLDETPPTVG